MRKSKLGIGCLVVAGILIVAGFAGYRFFKGAYNKFVTLDVAVSNRSTAAQPGGWADRDIHRHTWGLVVWSLW